MENGVGAQVHVAEVKMVEDAVSDSKVEDRGVGGDHGLKDSEEDEVFEEAIGSKSDDGNDGSDESKLALDDVAVGTIVNEGRDLGSSVADGGTSSGDKGETIKDVMEVPNEFRNEEEHSVETTHSLLGTDKLDDVPVPGLNHGEGVTGKDVSVENEKIIDVDSGLDSDNNAGQIKDVEHEELKKKSEENETKGEVESFAGGETEAEDGQHVEEKSIEIVLDKDVPENGDGNGVGKDNADSGQVIASTPSIVQGDENSKDLSSVGHDTSAGRLPEDRNAKAEEFEDLLPSDGKEYSSTESRDASNNLGLEGRSDDRVATSDASGNINREMQYGEHREPKNSQVTPLPANEVESKKLEGSSPIIDSSALKTTLASETQSSTPDDTAVEKKEKPETFVSERRMGYNGVDQPNFDVNVDKDRDSSIEAKKTDVKQNNRTSTETEIKPARSTVSSSGSSANPTLPPARPAGLGRAAPLLEPAPRAAHHPRTNEAVSQVQSQLVEETTNGDVEEGDETREKLQMIRVKFLRLAHRLGQTPHNVVVAQVLYRLGLAEQLRGRNGGRMGAFSFDRASAMAEQLEATGQEPLDFSCTIMVLGKTGVGKSATINSIFDEVKFSTDAFQTGTKKVQDVVGTVQGIKVRVIDTPGLLCSCLDQRHNVKILHSVKRFIKKTPPDIVLYLDRLDMQSRDFGDMPLLRTITEIFGPSIWFNAIVVLTHAASAPPEGPNGTASTYDMFVTQRSHAVQHAIRQAAGDMRLMNPVSLVENHSACRTNRAGQRVLPNGQVWKPHLLLLSFASKILAEANTLLKLQDTPPGKPFATRSRAPPLPFLLSSLLQPKPQVKLPEEQFGDDDALDDDLGDSSDSEDDSEYDELPPFKPLTKAQLEKLTRDQKKAYYDELEYREKLLMKKQLKEEKRRRKMMKKMAAAAKDSPADYSENVEEEAGGAASVPVPMPDLALPASFDSDNPTHRYRYLDTSNQWLVRPVLDTHGWDHDVGYEGINVEKMFVLREKIPLSFSGQVSKDKKEANLQMEVASSLKHGEGKATTMGFDMQSAGKDMSYTLRSETILSNFRHNKATLGLSLNLLGDTVSGGMKVEDKLIVNKRFRVVMSGGAMAGRGDVAYGGSLEATLRDKDYPLGHSLSSLSLSVMDWHGDLALGCNLQSQIPIGRFTNLIARANLNNRGSGQLSIRLNSSEQIQIALIGLVPLLRKLVGQSQPSPFGY